MAYQAGFDKGVSFQRDGAGSVVLNIQEWTWAEEVMKLVITHSGSQGVQAVIAGILSGEGNVQANVDAAALPSGAAGIRAGVKGTIVMATGAGTPFSIHVMIVKVNWRSIVTGLVTYNFDVTLDSTSGSYIHTA